MILMALTISCSRNGDESKAKALLEQAQNHFDEGQYQEALTLIDSLRSAYPNAIQARKEALVLYQNVELKKSQEDLEQIDSDLQTAKSNYEEKKTQVDALKASGRVGGQDIRSLNFAKKTLDSLEIAFETECAKIKYIKEKMGEDTTSLKK